MERVCKLNLSKPCAKQRLRNLALNYTPMRQPFCYLSTNKKLPSQSGTESLLLSFENTIEDKEKGI